MEHLRGGQTTLTEAEVHRVAATSSTRTTRPWTTRRPWPNSTAAPRLRPLALAQHPGPQAAGLCRVTLSLKPTGVAPGDITDKQLDAVADLAERYSFGQLRTSHEQNIILADVEQRQLFTLWGELRERLRHAEHRPADRHHLLPGR
jgi:sulfite reductase (NADPH) hemoprotein beta-component